MKTTFYFFPCYIESTINWLWLFILKPQLNVLDLVVPWGKLCIVSDMKPAQKAVFNALHITADRSDKWLYEKVFHKTFSTSCISVLKSMYCFDTVLFMSCQSIAILQWNMRVKSRASRLLGRIMCAHVAGTRTLFSWLASMRITDAVSLFSNLKRTPQHFSPPSLLCSLP